MQHPSMLPTHPSVRRLARPPALPSGSEYLRQRRQQQQQRSGGQKYKFHDRDYSPRPWSDYFSSRQDVRIDEKNVFRVYIREDADEASPEASSEKPVLLLLHGGGFSGLTWATFADEVAKLTKIRILALDLRGHGSTKTENDHELSVQTVTEDVTKVLRALYKDNIPEIILMGHSMGGAFAVHFVDLCPDEDIRSRVVGLVVIDVVEGTAKESLASMQQVLRGRPKSFRSINYAIEWYVRSGQSRNAEAAKVSMPGQIMEKRTGVCACDMQFEQKEKSTDENVNKDDQQPCPSSSGLPPLTEDEQMPAPALPPPPSSSSVNDDAFVWRTDLVASEKYWAEWFDRLSEIFLSSKGGAKLLLLAGVDRLDGPMTVGQMQGKFQMQVLPKVGHTIQEDDPETVAHVVAAYLIRNRFSVSKAQFDYPFPSC